MANSPAHCIRVAPVVLVVRTFEVIELLHDDRLANRRSLQSALHWGSYGAPNDTMVRGLEIAVATYQTILAPVENCDAALIDDSLRHCLALGAATLRPTPAALAPSATLGKDAGFSFVCPRGNLALATILSRCTFDSPSGAGQTDQCTRQIVPKKTDALALKLIMSAPLVMQSIELHFPSGPELRWAAVFVANSPVRLQGLQ